MAIRIDTVRGDDIVGDVRDRWCALISSGAAYSPLFHPDFVAVLARVRSDVEILVAEDGNGRMAFLPFHRRPFGLARPIGAVFSDYHGLISEPGFSVRPERLLRDAGLKSYPHFARIAANAHGANLRGLRADAGQRPAPLDAFERDHAKKAKQLRRLQRKLERDHGELVLEIGDPDWGAFDKLMEWKRDQYAATRRHDVLRPAWVRSLMTRLHQEGHGDLTGNLVSLRTGRRCVAAEFGPRWAGVFHPWIAAYDPQFAAYSPGHLLVMRLLGEMAGAGLERYDLGHDDAPYKSMFANAELPLKAGVWRADGASTPASWKHGLAGKISRRFEQVRLAELNTAGLLAGVAHAAHASLQGGK